jgi:UDP-N-acetylglucosamine--N-acetylmuramyl-(pentapeptide) pyrophosphoryl-undecaprenol N-acetylglucosamine transferase
MTASAFNAPGLKAPKVLIMAGGTGGHVFPALTIASELLARGTHVEWLGTRQGIEARVIANTSIPLHYITVSGLRGKSLVKKLLAPFVILVAIVQAWRQIRRIQPGCVLGMGGFATGPGGIAARLLGKRLLIHEQNAVAGLTNRILFPFATLVMEAFPGAFARKAQNRLLQSLVDQRKITVIGNPVRPGILAIAPPEERFPGRSGKLRLLVVGGSLGSVAINRVLPQALATLTGDERPQVKHQCGNRNLDDTRAWYEAAGLAPGPDLELSSFIDDMASAYVWADVILCRAGASTIAEIAAIGLPSILVPFPQSADDHQGENARILERAGAAKIIYQGDLSATGLASCLRELGTDRSRLLGYAQAARTIAVRDASTRAANLCLEACHG